MNSLEIREAKIGLIDMINGILLPLEVKRMMLREIMCELEAATENEIKGYLSKREKKDKESTDTAKESEGKSDE